MRKTPVMGWIPREGAVLDKIDIHGQPYQLRINSGGQRGGEVIDLVPYHQRVLYLGDSFTFASDTPEEATFVKLSAALLSEEGVRVQPVNGGVDGYSTYQELAYYRYVGSVLEPDVVVLCFFAGNDFRDNMVVSRQGNFLSPALIADPHKYQNRHRDRMLRKEGEVLLDPLADHPVVRPESAFVEYLQGKSLLARLLGSRVNQLKARWGGNLEWLGSDQGYHYYEIGLMQGKEDGLIRTAVELTLDCILQLSLMVTRDGSEFVVVLLPSQDQVNPVAWWRRAASSPAR